MNNMDRCGRPSWIDQSKNETFRRLKTYLYQLVFLMLDLLATNTCKILLGFCSSTLNFYNSLVFTNHSCTNRLSIELLSSAALSPVKSSDISSSGLQSKLRGSPSVANNDISNSSLRQLCCKIILTSLVFGTIQKMKNYQDWKIIEFSQTWKGNIYTEIKRYLRKIHSSVLCPEAWHSGFLQSCKILQQSHFHHHQILTSHD